MLFYFLVTIRFNICWGEFLLYLIFGGDFSINDDEAVIPGNLAARDNVI